MYPGCTIVLTLTVLASAGAAQQTFSPLDALTALLRNSNDPAVQRDVLRGMGDALAGRRGVPAPRGWAAVHDKLLASPDAEVRERGLALSVLFGDPRALKQLEQLVLDSKAEPASRLRALEVLLDRGSADLPALLRRLLDDPTLRRPAIRGLARHGSSDTPAWLLERMAKWSVEERFDAVATLTSRPAYALALLDAVESQRVPRSDLGVLHARQLLALNDAKVTTRLNTVWGSIRPTSKDREQLLVRYRKLATPEQLKKANRAEGRLVWNRTCASCHMLFGEGNKIGPDLTGSQRSNPDYLLHKLLDPSAVVPKDYQVTRIVTTAGRVLTGVVTQETEQSLLLQTPTEQLRLRQSDIEEREKTNSSLMPEGLLQLLSDTEIRNLLAYIAGSGQVAPPPGRK